MMYDCVGDCSQCPFYYEEKKSAKTKSTVVETSESDVTENSLSVVTAPQYRVKRNIFGKEKVVLVEE